MRQRTSVFVEIVRRSRPRANFRTMSIEEVRASKANLQQDLNQVGGTPQELFRAQTIIDRMEAAQDVIVEKSKIAWDMAIQRGRQMEQSFKKAAEAFDDVKALSGISSPGLGNGESGNVMFPTEGVNSNATPMLDNMTQLIGVTEGYNQVNLSRLEIEATMDEMALSLGEKEFARFEQMERGVELVNMMAGAFAGLASSMLASVIAGEKSNVSFKTVLQTLSQTALAQAIYHTAIGIAAATPWGGAIYGDPGGVRNFKAAATFGAAGVALGVASRFAGGGGASGIAGAGGSGGLFPQPEAGNAGGPQVTLILEGQGIVTDPGAFAREIAIAIEDSNG